MAIELALMATDTKKAIKNSPRECDIDIIAYGNKIIRNKFFSGSILDQINNDIPINNCIKKIQDFLCPIFFVSQNIFNLSTRGAQR